MTKHTHGKASIVLKIDNETLIGEIEGTASDIKHLIAHSVENDPKLEEVFLGALQMLATARIVDIIGEEEKKKKLEKGSEVKN